MSTTISFFDGEVHVLTDLVTQLVALYEESDLADPAMERLSPIAYRGDAAAAAEFRRLTSDDLLSQRIRDATAVLATLSAGPSDTSAAVDEDPRGTLEVSLSDDDVLAWMRTLAALRLVLATRLGIDTADENDAEHDDENPTVAIYDWLAYRLEMLVEATES